MKIQNVKPWTTHRIAIAVLILASLLNPGCGKEEKKNEVREGTLAIDIRATVPLEIDGFTFSTPLLYPDVENEGVFIAGANSNSIYSFSEENGLELLVVPDSVPEGAEGISAFCYAEGDFFYHPSSRALGISDASTDIYQLTGGGRIREQDLPDELLEDVMDIGALAYLGDGRLMIETKPKGPFAIMDFISGNPERFPAELESRGLTQFVVADHGAGEIYIARRAEDYSIYFLRFPFAGGFNGVKYIQRTQLFPAAATWRGTHLMQYASGEIDSYDAMFKRIRTYNLRDFARVEYSMFLWFTVTGDTGYVIGARGETSAPEGYDLIVLGLSIS